MRRALAALVGLLVLALLWPAVRWTLADRYAQTQPQRALALIDGHPQALAAAAAEAIAADDLIAADRLARAAIAARPLESRGWRLLAAIDQQAGRLPEATAAHQAAIAVAPSDAISRLWLGSLRLSQGRYQQALGDIDRGLRAQPAWRDQVFAVLVPGIAQPQFAAAMVAQLERNPPWRREFVEAVTVGDQDTDRVIGFADDLADARPLPRAEAQAVISRLQRDQRWPEMRAAWLRQQDRATGAEAPLLANGNFASDPEGFGLGWRFSGSAGSMLGLDAGIGGGEGARALSIQFLQQRVDFQNVWQLLLLEPGRYRFDGEARGLGLRTTGALRWDVLCYGDSLRLGDGPALRDGATWASFAFDFVVPPDCPAQWLRLILQASGPSQQWIGGTAQYRQLTLRAVAPSALGPAE